MSEPMKVVQDPRNANGTFAKGRSGNPRGRPPRMEMAATPRGLESAILAIAHETVSIMVDGKRRRMPAIQLLIYRLMQQALKGHHRSSIEFLRLYAACSRENELNLSKEFRSALDMFEEEVAHRRRGQVDPVLLRSLNDYRELSKPQFPTALGSAPVRRRRKRLPSTSY